jgi:hypothetical protein
MFLFKIFLAFGLLNGQPTTKNQEIVTKTPIIISLKTDYPMEGSWVRIPKGTKKITFKIQAENTETILFWLIPTGTKDLDRKKAYWL